jgi:U2 small nuclear ribonucleoprotein A'
VLTNNDIKTLGDVSALGELPLLRHLSLMHNPVTRVEHYRLFVIFKCKSLEVLDFQKVTRKERYKTQQLFSGDSGAALLAKLSSSGSDATNAGSAVASSSSSSSTGKRSRTDPAEEALKARIARAIQTAKTLDEVTQLQKALQDQAMERIVPLLEQIEASANDSSKRSKTTPE